MLFQTKEFAWNLEKLVLLNLGLYLKLLHTYNNFWAYVIIIDVLFFVFQKLLHHSPC